VSTWPDERRLARTRDDRAARLARTRGHLGAVSWALDSVFRVPGTRFRFGLDPLIGLVPGAGDLASAAIAVYVLLRALQFRVPRIVIARMAANTLLDLTIGSVPVLGDLFDFAYKSNARNMRLLEAYAGEPGRSTRREWLFFLVIAAIVAVAVALLWLALSWLAAELARLP
jgi:Domain of unknown function (DUF4112)